MKKYIATFWRINEQLSNGGYETTRTIEARNLASAEKKALKITKACRYGGMELVNLVEA